MIPILDHIFNSLYRFHKRLKVFDPESASMLAIVSFEWCIMVFFMQLLNVLPRDFNKLNWLIVFLILVVINYTLLIKRNKYKAIERVYRRNDKRAIRVTFDILSVLLFIFSILVAYGFFL